VFAHQELWGLHEAYVQGCLEPSSSLQQHKGHQGGNQERWIHDSPLDYGLLRDTGPHDSRSREQDAFKAPVHGVDQNVDTVDHRQRYSVREVFPIWHVVVVQETGVG
jgi:hypothetical protein